MRKLKNIQKVLFVFFVVFSFFPLFSSAQFYEDFSDGEIYINPRWQGNVDLFRITSSTAIPAEMRPGLQLYDSVAGRSYLSSELILSNVDSLHWSFWVKLSFNPSANNFARFYLLSDSANITLDVSGLFVSIGEFSKKISLYSQEKDSIHLLVEGPVISKSTNVARVQVNKDIDNKFRFFVDTLGNEDYILFGEKEYSFQYGESSYLGLYCKYTKSNSTKIYWDDIIVQVLESDTVKPKLEYYEIAEPNILYLYFSEELDSISGNNDLNYYLEPELKPIYALLERNKVTLPFYPYFEKNLEYTLTIKGLKDLAGNLMDEKQVSFILEEEPQKNIEDTLDFIVEIEKGEILINEVLFNPYPNGSDFVEIYNNTDKDLYLDSLCIATWDIENQELKTITSFGDSLLFKSQDYLVVTKDAADIQWNYYVPHPEKIIQLKSLPSYPDKEGIVILCTKNGKIIDRFDYKEDMHFQLLSSKDGVSLERRSFLLPTNDKNNWQSASKTTNWATPTYKNSQHTDFLYSEEPFTLEPNPFVPDLDGVDDFLNINYRLHEDGLLCNITIFDSKGRFVRYLKKNELLGREGSFVWDGVNEQGRKCPIGNYIVSIEVFSLKGDRHFFKKVITLL